MGRGSPGLLRSQIDNPRISQPLDTVGDGTGDTDGIVDGSVTPVTFRFNPPIPDAPDGSISGNFLLTSIIVSIRTNAPMDADRYGRGASLPNGVLIGAFDQATGDLIQDFTGGPIRLNADWGRIMNITVPWGRQMYAGWDVFSFSSIAINLKRGEDFYIGVRVQDNLTLASYGLLEHMFYVQGLVEHR